MPCAAGSTVAAARVRWWRRASAAPPDSETWPVHPTRASARRKRSLDGRSTWSCMRSRASSSLTAPSACQNAASATPGACVASSSSSAGSVLGTSRAPTRTTGRRTGSKCTSVPKRSSRIPSYAGMRSLLQGRPDAASGERAPPGEDVSLAMPERDLGLAELPAEEHELAVELAGEVDEAERDVLQLGAIALDLAHDCFELLDERARLRTMTHQHGARHAARIDAASRGQGPPFLVEPQGAALEAFQQHREARHLRVGLVHREELRRELLPPRRALVRRLPDLRKRPGGRLTARAMGVETNAFDSPCPTRGCGLESRRGWPTRIRSSMVARARRPDASTASKRTSATFRSPTCCPSCRCAGW